MAGGEPVELFGYRFIAKPMSRLHRIPGDFFPYWQALKPTFILNVTKIEQAAQGKYVDWLVIFSNGHTTGGKVNIPALSMGEHSNPFVIGDKFLGYTGDTILAVPFNSDGKIQYRTLYAFHTTPKAWLALTLIAGLIAGLFASLFQWIANLFN